MITHCELERMLKESVIDCFLDIIFAFVRKMKTPWMAGVGGEFRNRCKPVVPTMMKHILWCPRQT
jgi:hypothetical protein